MFHSHLPRALWLLMFLAVLVLTACGTPAPDPGGDAPGDEPVIAGMAQVENIDILLMESFPLQVSVYVEGYLPDGCTEIDQISETFDPENNTFLVEITTVRPAEAICTQVIVAFEENVPLDVYGLPAGTYTVDVNGVTGTFTFDVDNILPEE